MPKSRVDTPSQGKVTASHSKAAARHIRSKESDAPDMALAARIRELIGNDANTSFAAACGFSEGMLRKYLKGAQPRPQYLANMADYRNVNIQWLATGAEPKSRTPVMMQMLESGKTLKGMLAMQYTNGGSNVAPNGAINSALLCLCLEACKQVHGEDFSKTLTDSQLLFAADFYNQLVALANAKTPHADLDDFCRLDAQAMAEQLRFFLKMGWAMKFNPKGGEFGSW